MNGNERAVLGSGVKQVCSPLHPVPELKTLCRPEGGCDLRWVDPKATVTTGLKVCLNRVREMLLVWQPELGGPY